MCTTDFLNRVMGNVFNTDTSVALPRTYYLGLSTTMPNVDGSNVTEPSSGTGYARVALTCMTAPTNGVITNSQIITFAESTADWGVVRAFILFGSQSGSDPLVYNSLTTPKTVEMDTIVVIKPGNLTLKLLDGASGVLTATDGSVLVNAASVNDILTTIGY